MTSSEVIYLTYSYNIFLCLQVFILTAGRRRGRGRGTRSRLSLAASRPSRVSSRHSGARCPAPRPPCSTTGSGSSISATTPSPTPSRANASVREMAPGVIPFSLARGRSICAKPCPLQAKVTPSSSSMLSTSLVTKMAGARRDSRKLSTESTNWSARCLTPSMTSI